MRSLEDAEQRLADVRESVAADKHSKNGTSPQPDNEQKEHDGHNADDSREPRARSLPIEELSIHSRSERAKSNKTSVISKTSSARRVMHLELKALKEHEEKNCTSAWRNWNEKQNNWNEKQKKKR